MTREEAKLLEVGQVVLFWEREHGTRKRKVEHFGRFKSVGRKTATIEIAGFPYEDGTGWYSPPYNRRIRLEDLRPYEKPNTEEMKSVKVKRSK